MAFETRILPSSPLPEIPKPAGLPGPGAVALVSCRPPELVDSRNRVATQESGGNPGSVTGSQADLREVLQPTELWFPHTQNHESGVPQGGVGRRRGRIPEAAS